LVYVRFTEAARRVVVRAQEEARELAHGSIEAEHLLLALVAVPEGARRALESAGVREAAVRARFVEIIGRGEGSALGAIPLAVAAESALEGAEREAVALGHHDVTAEHILLGLMNEDNRAVRLLGTFGVDPTAVCDAVMPFLPATGRAVSSLTPEPQAAGAPAAGRSRGERQAKPMITALSAEQAENFAILRRAETDEDRLPGERQEGLRTGLVARQGLNPALARRARTSIGDVWIIPGNGNIALDVGGMSVADVEGAIARGMVTWTSTSSREQDIVHGLVPDGVQEVTLTASNGATTTVAVKDNVYGAMLDGRFTAVSVTTPPDSDVKGFSLGPPTARQG
jgi:hypothetical protein